MEKNKCNDDLALRQFIDEQVRQAERMELSEGFADRLMHKLDAMSGTQSDASNRNSSIVMLRKVAAVFAVAIVISGIVYATYSSMRSGHGDSAPSASVEAGVEDVAMALDSVVRFEGLPLDIILRAVSVHYNRSVCFRDAVDSMRLSTTWDSEQPLSAFIALINEFDGLRLTDRGDTIFVESVKAED